MKYRVVGVRNLRIGEFVAMVMEDLRSLSLTEELTYNVQLTLWELLANAVQYGGNPYETIEIHIHQQEELLHIDWYDQTQSFDWQTALYHEWPEPTEVGGRGLLLIKEICRTILFNETGSHITIIFERKAEEY